MVRTTHPHLRALQGACPGGLQLCIFSECDHLTHTRPRCPQAGTTFPKCAPSPGGLCVSQTAYLGGVPFGASGSLPGTIGVLYLWPCRKRIPSPPAPQAGWVPGRRRPHAPTPSPLIRHRPEGESGVAKFRGFLLRMLTTSLEGSSPCPTCCQ